MSFVSDEGDSVMSDQQQGPAGPPRQAERPTNVSQGGSLVADSCYSISLCLHISVMMLPNQGWPLSPE